MKPMNTRLRTSTLRAKIRHGRSKGMTLLEIMIVVAILGLLASVIVVAVINQFDGAKIKATRLKLKSVEQALFQYSIDHGFPSQNEGLRVLMAPPGGGRSYLKDAPRDPWNNDVLYFNPARTGSDPFEVLSKGPDGREGTEDDIHAKEQKKLR